MPAKIDPPVPLAARGSIGLRWDYGELLADETEKWRKVIRAANVKAE